jgi:hypothetical protein
MTDPDKNLDYFDMIETELNCTIWWVYFLNLDKSFAIL